jgi:uncharacterized protein
MRKICLLAFTILPVALMAQKTILWKVTDRAAIHTSYLLGTYHLLDKTFVDSLNVVSDKLKSCDIVITEVKKDSASIVNYYEKREPSDQLNKILSKADIDLINRILMYSTVKNVNKLTPGELFAKLTGYYDAFCLGLTDEKMRIDDYIQFLGTQNGKKQIYLESDTLQIELLRKATEPIDWKFFRKNITQLLDKYKHPETTISSNSFYKKYVTFDLNYSFSESCNGDVLVEQRNNKWVPEITKALTENNCFVAVGLAHYFKTCGIIEQLRREGYTVEEVPMR